MSKLDPKKESYTKYRDLLSQILKVCLIQSLGSPSREPAALEMDLAIYMLSFKDKEYDDLIVDLLQSIQTPSLHRLQSRLA